MSREVVIYAKTYPYIRLAKNLNYNINAWVKIIERYRIQFQEYRDLYRQVISFTKIQSSIRKNYDSKIYL